jgi:DNA-binding transcriptional ArsR family regulator
MSSRSAAKRVAGTAPVFAALGDATRLRLVARLSDEGPQSLTSLTEGTEVTRQAIAKHLRVLEGAGLARGTRSGREVRWAIEPTPLEDARRFLEDVSARWDDALSRLRRHVEGSGKG